MNTKTTILIKVDKKVKAAAQKAAKEIGIPLSTIMGAQLRKFAHEGRVEFEKPLIPTPQAARWIREARKEFEEGKTKRFATMEELIADLRD
jgi:antitoxin component of RelBE/YafQ-DinJ toxin-antitoxin module